jgi:1,2-dihydroxy-3-keto-5-methylthiopentene dioxygenase
MQKHGFLSCDVINVYPEMENITALREKFLSEHTHSEDEVRFFVEGEGKFWFHLENG